MSSVPGRSCEQVRPAEIGNGGQCCPGHITGGAAPANAGRRVLGLCPEIASHRGPNIVQLQLPFMNERDGAE
jgi:hypothetical protein